MATYLYEHVAVWSSCALVVQRLRCLVPTRLAEAAIQRRGAALQLHAVAEWCRARGRRRRERPLASLLSVAAKALGLLARPRIAPGRARCHFGTYAVDVEALGRAKRAVVAPLACLGDSITDHVPAHINQTLTPRVAHYLQSWRMYSSQSHSRHSTVDLPSTNLSSIGWGFVLRVLGRARRAGCALR